MLLRFGNPLVPRWIKPSERLYQHIALDLALDYIRTTMLIIRQRNAAITETRVFFTVSESLRATSKSYVPRPRGSKEKSSRGRTEGRMSIFAFASASALNEPSTTVVVLESPSAFAPPFLLPPWPSPTIFLTLCHGHWSTNRHRMKKHQIFLFPSRPGSAFEAERSEPHARTSTRHPAPVMLCTEAI